jgi:hypothetical protein
MLSSFSDTVYQNVEKKVREKMRRQLQKRRASGEVCREESRATDRQRLMWLRAMLEMAMVYRQPITELERWVVEEKLLAKRLCLASFVPQAPGSIACQSREQVS